MATPVRQASFIGGEIAPGLHARTNLKRYADSARLLRNMLARQEGPATNRPGLLHKGAAKVDSGVGRLIPFVFSSGTLANNFELEFTAGFIRIWKAGVLVESAPGVPLTVATTYTDEEIPRLKFVQSGQVLTIFCKQKTPKELTWVTDTNWTFTDFAIARAITAPTGLAITQPAPQGDATILAKVWQIVVTAVKAETKEESLPSTFVQDTMAINTNKPAQYTWNAVSGASEYNVYRGRNGKFGFIGTAVGTTFNDDGQSPVYAETPPTNRDPFPGADDRPQVGTYHDQRLALANAWNAPGEIEMSRMGEYENFDRAVPPKATDAVTLNVSGTQYEEIRSLVSYGRNLLVMTNLTEQLITGSEGVITQDDIVFDDMPTKWGSSWLDPLLIGTAVLFVQDVGATVRELVPADKQSGNDLTLLAQHLFTGRQIVSWCYAHEPFRVVWAVRDDGALLSCTYVRQHETWAWARHDTGDGDLFEGICSVPEGGENAVYVLVKRYVGGVWKRYVERFAPRVNQSLADGVFLDSAITKTNVTAVTGLGHLEGRTVYALADGVVRGPFVVAGGSITLPVLAAKVHVGLRITAQGHTLDAYSATEEVRVRRKNVKRVYAEVEGSMPFKAGQRLTDGLELSSRPDAADWTAPYTGLVQINTNSDYDDSGAVVWEHTDPTPLTIMSIIREIEFGGR
jgi:hypothetical protein